MPLQERHFWSRKTKGKQRKAYPSVCRCIILACLPAPRAVPKAQSGGDEAIHVRADSFLTSSQANADHINLLVLYIWEEKGDMSQLLFSSHTSAPIVRQPWRNELTSFGISIQRSLMSSQYQSAMAETRHNVEIDCNHVDTFHPWHHLQAVM